MLLHMHACVLCTNISEVETPRTIADRRVTKKKQARGTIASHQRNYGEKTGGGIREKSVVRTSARDDNREMVINSRGRRSSGVIVKRLYR